MIFEIGIYHYTILSAFLFFTGVFGIFLNRTNLIIILMSLELILLSVSINFISFSVNFLVVASLLVPVIVTDGKNSLFEIFPITRQSHNLL